MAKRKDNPSPVEVTGPATAPGQAADLAAPERVADTVPQPSEAAAPADGKAGPHDAGGSDGSRGGRFALLAASVAVAAATGAVLGSLATAAIMPAPAPAASGRDDILALKEGIVRLSSDLVAVKAGVEAAAKSAGGHFTRLAERIERAEKAQGEPAAKLSRIAESLERLEKRPIPASAEVTGSVPAAPAQADKDAKPAIVNGWIVRDIYDGHALVESRWGAMLEVRPGSNIPGIGRVEAVRRQEGRWVVVTPKGVITSYR